MRDVKYCTNRSHPGIGIRLRTVRAAWRRDVACAEGACSNRRTQPDLSSCCRASRSYDSGTRMDEFPTSSHSLYSPGLFLGSPSRSGQSATAECGPARKPRHNLCLNVVLRSLRPIMHLLPEIVSTGQHESGCLSSTIRRVFGNCPKRAASRPRERLLDRLLNI